MAKICLSYRRSDAAIVGRIYDRLVARYGAESVFMDVSDIPFGADYRKQIQASFEDTAIVLAFIGASWTGDQAQKQTRIHDKIDPVRIEIGTALARGILVIPVLVNGAQMPMPDELPRDIREIAFRNAPTIDAGADFSLHLERLAATIDERLGIKRTGTTEGRGLASISTRQGAEARAQSAPQGSLFARLLPYIVTPIVLMLLAHYLIIVKLDLNPDIFRVFTIVVPLACGFLLFRNLRISLGTTIMLGMCIALVSIACMLTIIGLVDANPILPTGAYEWQETIEYLVTMTLAMAAGNLLGRVTLSAIPGRIRWF